MRTQYQDKKSISWQTDEIVKQLTQGDKFENTYSPEVLRSGLERSIKGGATHAYLSIHEGMGDLKKMRDGIERIYNALEVAKQENIKIHDLETIEIYFKDLTKKHQAQSMDEAYKMNAHMEMLKEKFPPLTDYTDILKAVDWREI